MNKLLKLSLRRSSSSSSSSLSTTTFKYSANISSKDCIRCAFIYGMCGTVSSYLSMKYDGKVLVIGFSVPTPERFVFCTWCWSFAGMAAWKIFCTKPNSLIRAAQSRIRYGLLHGAQVCNFFYFFSIKLEYSRIFKNK